MRRIAIIGNGGGGKSTLARRMAASCALPWIEVDKLLWRTGWTLAPAEDYEVEHSRLIAQDRWLIDGLGRRESIGPRLQRATKIVLVDMPLWMHFWLAAERQIAWAKGGVEQTPGGFADMPPTEALFRTIWQVDQEWMPMLRAKVEECERQGAEVTRIASVDALTELERSLVDH